MPIPLKQAILGASTIILSKYIDKYVFRGGSNFYETVFIHPLLYAELLTGPNHSQMQ